MTDTTRPILRLTDKYGDPWSHWILNGRVVRRFVAPDYTAPAQVMAADGWAWVATDQHAADCGTTLAAIRAQLLEMEESK